MLRFETYNKPKTLMLLLVIRGNKDVAFNECSKRLHNPWKIDQELWEGTVTLVTTDMVNNHIIYKWYLETSASASLPLFENGSLLFYQEVLR